MSSDGELTQKIIASFYEGILDPDCWTTGLRQISELTLSGSAALTVWDRRVNDGSIHESALLPDDCRELYNTHYTWLDPARTRIDGFLVGQWYIDQVHFGTRNMRSSEFYQDFMRRYDFGSVMVCPLIRMDGVESFLSIERATRQPAYDHADTRVLADLLPHLQRAIRIRASLELANQRSSIAGRVLDEIVVPLFVADEYGALLMTNRAGDRLLASRVGFQVNGARITLPHSPPGQLDEYLRRACGRRGAPTANGMRVHNPSKQVALQVIVLPLPAHNELNFPYQRPLAMILAYDPGLARPESQQVLRQLFGLTPAEARLVAELLNGLTLNETAAKLNLGVSTVRSQLKSVFRKTGIARQADLLRTMSVMRLLDLPG